MKTETVVLPEPGRQLLHAGYPILRQWLPDRPGLAGFIIGGGTMLAARWRHRNSQDIDVKVNGETGYALISRAREEPMVKAKLDREMSAAGSTGNRWLSPIQLIYTFGTTDDDDPPRIDMTEFAPKTHMAVVRTTSEGMTFWTSTNDEILAGKWNDRRLDLLVRDVFDFAVAGAADGQALQSAIAMDASAETLDDMVKRFVRQRGRLKELAKTRVLGVPRQLKEVQLDPAVWAARAIGRWAATEVMVEHGTEAWQVSAACKAKPEGCAQGEYKDLTHAVRRASALGGLSSEDRLEFYEAANSQGGARARGGRGKMKESCEREMNVRSNGTVEMRDFGEKAVDAPTVEASVEIAIERGWEKESDREVIVTELRELQQQAMAREQQHTLN